MSAPLRILLLGPPAVIYGDRQVKITRREVRGLLYYLACQRAPVSRDHLVDLFWPELTEEDGRKRLRESLARLRKALPEPGLLEATAEQVGLAQGRIATDVLEFQSIVDEIARPLAQLPPTAPLSQNFYQKIVAGVQLWRSPMFLAGVRLPAAVRLEDWQMRMHQNLEASYLKLLQRLADHDLATGNLEQAAAWLRTATEIDPFNDSLHERMIVLYERRGWFAEALAYLKRIRALYAREHVSYLPAALEPIEKRLRKSLTLPRDDQPTLWPNQRASQMPLFGREAELERLRTAYQKGGVVLLRGEAGSGKTRLVEAFYRSLQPPPRMLVAFCRPLEDNLPFQAIIDMLRSQVSADEWRKLSRSWLSIIHLLLPELSVAFPDLPSAPVSSSISQPLVYEALHQAILSLNTNQRLLLFVENAHWCDESSLGALAYFYEHGVFGHRACLLLASRIEDQPPSLTRFFNLLGSQNALQEIPTSPLPVEAIAGLAEYILGQAITPAAAERLRYDTGGNPLFLFENLRTLLEQSIDLQDAGAFDHLPLSSSFHALVYGRFQLLSPDAQQLITAAAVIGSEFDVSLLEACVHLDPETLASCLEELERRYLILPLTDSVRIRYRFVHDQVREIAQGQLSPARRRIYHLRVVNALQSRRASGDASQAAAIARHYEQAGEVLSAFEAWLEAAQYARRLFSIPEAMVAYQRADQLLAQLNLQVSDAQVNDLYTGWIDLCVNSARPDELSAAAQAFLRQGFMRQNDAFIKKGFLKQAAAAHLHGDADEGLKLLEQVLPYLQMHQHLTDWAEYHYERGGFFLLNGNIREAIQEHEQALRIVESSNDPAYIEIRANTRYRLSLSFLYNGWPSKARQQAELTMEDSRRMMNHNVGARGMFALAQAEFYLGFYTSALEHATLALRMALPMGNNRQASIVHNILAEILLVLGRPDEAWEHTLFAAEQIDPLRYPRPRANALRIQGDIFAAFGDAETAEARYRLALAGQTYYHSSLNAARHLGWALAQNGQIEAGLGVLDEALCFAEQAGFDLQALALQQERGWALMKLGQPDLALQLAERVAIEATDREAPWLRVMAYWMHSELAARAGRIDEAQQKLLAILRIAQDLSFPMLEIHAIGNLAHLFGAESPEYLSHRDRLKGLLSALDQNTRRPELRPLFEKLAHTLQFRN